MRTQPLVYVVDDDPVFNSLFLHVLRKMGVAVEAFQAPEGILERVRSRKPDLCVVDLNLGTAVKGWDLIRSLREHARGAMPILIASGTGDASAVARALEMGANDYLLKPLDRDVLASKLSAYLRTDELEDETGPAASGQSEIDTTLGLDARLVEVDETGFRLLSRHLITRGTVLTLSGTVIAEMTGQDRRLMVTVVSTSLDTAKGLYTIYAELDATNAHLAQPIRDWLSKPPSPRRA